MAEYIVKESGYPGRLETEIVGELVRCKDCKYWREGTIYSYCEKLYRMGVLDIYCYMTSDDDYCSLAERRSDEKKNF